MPNTTIEENRGVGIQASSDWSTVIFTVSFEALWSVLQMSSEPVAVLDSNHQIIRSSSDFHTIFPHATRLQDVVSRRDLQPDEEPYKNHKFSSTITQGGESLTIRCDQLLCSSDCYRAYGPRSIAVIPPGARHDVHRF